MRGYGASAGSGVLPPTAERSTSMCCLRHTPALPRLSARWECGFVPGVAPLRACHRFDLACLRRAGLAPLPLPLSVERSGASPALRKSGTRGFAFSRSKPPPQRHRRTSCPGGSGASRPGMACGRSSEPWTAEPSDAPDPPGHDGPLRSRRSRFKPDRHDGPRRSRRSCFKPNRYGGGPLRSRRSCLRFEPESRWVPPAWMPCRAGANLGRRTLAISAASATILP